MKRTTYIIFGMLLAGLVVMCGGIFYTSTLFTGWDDIFMDINGEQKTVQLPECKVVQMVVNKDYAILADDEDMQEVGSVNFYNAPLTVCSADSASGTFTYASDMDEYMTIKPVGDTLYIVFSFPKDKFEKNQRDMRWINARSAEMILALPSTVQRVTSDLDDQQITFKGITCDTLSFAVDSRAIVENCQFGALHVINGNLNLNSGKADNLHLYLDRIRSWNVNASSFHVDTEYLYASGNPRCTLEKGECRQVVWMPQSDGASLNIELKQAARVVVE